MRELEQITHEAWVALQSGRTDGWPEAARNAMEILHPEATTAEEAQAREDRITATADFVGKIVANPMEPVVLHEQDGIYPEMHHFGTLVPDPDEPVTLMSPKSDEERSAVIRINGLTHKTITVDNTPDTSVKVWMVAGTGWQGSSPDHILANRPNMSMAAGAVEVGQLLDRLAGREDMNVDRLFAAVFHIGWLGVDFDAAAPVTTAFADHIQRSRQSLGEQDKAIGSAIFSSNRVQEDLMAAQGLLQRRVAVTTAQLQQARDLMGDIPMPPLMSREAYESVNATIEQVVHAVDSLQRRDRLQRRARTGVQKQLKIIQQLANAQPA